MEHKEYKPKKSSLKKHTLPEWYDDAKLGIFIHWGLYSVPAYGTLAGNTHDVIRTKGIKWYYKNNPYAEWYWNSIRIQDSPASIYHKEKYGESFQYEDFATEFNDKLKYWNPDKWADIFKEIGAKYVVFTSKHHDGFRLFPSENPHPVKGDYCANRDVVGELKVALEKKGIRLGLYYSGALDWSFTPWPIRDAVDLVNNGPKTEEYLHYVENHFRELIDKYQPCILWNDIGSPPKLNFYKIFAYYYNHVPDGLVDDRWLKFSGIVRFGSKLLRPYINYFIPKILNKGPMAQPKLFHCDYLTPEYSIFSDIKKTKWELTRGVGNSFGYNQFEGPEHHLTGDAIIKLFIDIVSKNGNMLMNIGPKVGGDISELQLKPLLIFGTWLKKNGVGLFGTRPWIRAEGTTTDQIPIRFAQKSDHLFAFLLDKPQTSQVIIKDLKIPQNAQVKMLETDEIISWNQSGNDLSINLPDSQSWNSALGLDIALK